MEKYDAIIIGYGKAGKTLAEDLAKRNWKVAIIEKDPEMYGGTCINIGCIPTKALVHDGLHEIPYKDAVVRKNDVVAKLRTKNFNMLNELDYVTIYEADARFLSNKEIEIEGNDETKVLVGDHIFINTGATGNIPPIEGIESTNKVYTSTTLIDRHDLPKRLTIIGGGYIGLEYASMYANFGSEVTMVMPESELIPREDREIATEVQKVLEDKGIRFIFETKTEKITEENNTVILSLSNDEKLKADVVLLATGRKPNVEKLGLENTAIELTERGAVKVENNLETTVSNIWAVGDVRGGMQFTYISLDDYRIVMNQLFGDKNYTLNTRKNVPYSVFIDPPLSRVGLTEKEAKEHGFEVSVNTLSVTSIPRSKVINDSRGLFKAVIDNKTDKILGVTLFGPDSHELSNLIKLAMDLDAPYTYLRDQIYNHPVMSESLNNLFALK